ncbi:hypothetical protein PAHAL_8G019100 [Panicum hallii]|uniref:Secreted protein n=1 Tax=Panicum hallii TaxID=206008 RepID=A0A270R7Z0_9POAL|nr:hypothetical protein PAHAL_8G018600 [Panicum hallii]PVH33534.1 hypothetical protein PAHAL_8G019100 [Panicum hallii]
MHRFLLGFGNSLLVLARMNILSCVSTPTSQMEFKCNSKRKNLQCSQTHQFGYQLVAGCHYSRIYRTS